MAYAVRFRFQFASDNGNIYRMDILEDGYSGSIVQRPLGGAPELRREKNGAICGTSLEFPAQAQVDGELAVLYASSAQAFRVDLYANNSLIWQGYITPELYSEPYVAPPYNVRVTATDNLGELKLSGYTAQGSVTIATLLSGILSHTGLSFPVHWLSVMHPSEDADVDPEDMASSVTINLDHMAGKSLYDVLQTTLDTFHAFIVQQGCQWLIVRETDLECLRDDDIVEAPDGSEFTIGDFGSMQNEIWWPVGYLSQTVVPAKREKVISAPNNWIANLLPAAATSLINGQHVEPDNGDMPFYELTPWNSSQEPVTASVAFWSDFAEMVPPCDLTLSLALATFGTLSGHQYGRKCAEVAVKVIGSDGSSYINMWVDGEGNLTTEATPALSIDGTYRETPEQFNIAVPIASQMSALGFARVYQIQVTITTTDEEDSISRMRIYEWTLNAPEQNKGFQVTCQLNNAARGTDASVEIAAADNLDKSYETILITNGFKFSNVVSGHGGESIEEWASGNINSMPLLEFLARDYCFSIALPRLRMDGYMNVPQGAALPLLFRGGGLIYWPETWSWDLRRDRLDISMLSLPAAAIQVTGVIRQAQGSGGFVGGYSGGGSGSGGDRNYFEEDGNGGIKLKDKYTGLWAAGFMTAFGQGSGGSSGGVDLARVWQSLTNEIPDDYASTQIHINHIPMLGIWRDFAEDSSLQSKDANTKIALSHIPDITTSKISNLGTWAGSQSITTLGTVTTGVWHGTTIGAQYGGTGTTGFTDAYRVVYSLSATQLGTLAPNSTSTRKYLSQINGLAPEWVEVSTSIPAATNDAIGGFKTGYSGAGAKYYAVQLNNSDQAYVYVPWTDNNDTYKFTLNGTTNGASGGTSLGSCYAPTVAGTSGYVLASSGSGAPTWINNPTFSAARLKPENANYGSRLYFGDDAYAYIYEDTDDHLLIYADKGLTINTGSSYGLNVTTTTTIGTSGSNKNLTVYGAVYVGGASSYWEIDSSSRMHTNAAAKIDGPLTCMGNISAAGNITADGNLRTDGAVYIGGGSQYINYVSANSGLHTNVGFYSDKYLVGFQSMSASDKRLKTNLRDVELTVNQIAAAPAVTFDWLDQAKGSGIGSIAQYWQQLLPQGVHPFDGDYLSMEYGNIALVSSIVLARKVRELEKQIKDLRRRVAA